MINRIRKYKVSPSDCLKFIELVSLLEEYAVYTIVYDQTTKYFVAEVILYSEVAAKLINNVLVTCLPAIGIMEVVPYGKQ